MKVITAVFAAFALVLMVACNSDDAGNSGFDDQRPNPTAKPVDVSIDPSFHDAIDFSPAANPAEREQAYFQVAAQLAEPFTPKPNQNLVFELRWEEPIDGNANILITGSFQEGDRWVERQADFRITRTAVGNWILKDEVDFVKTAYQRNLDYEEQKKIDDENQRQEDLARLNLIQEAFDSVTVGFINTEYVPAESGRPGIDGFVFHLWLSNPTQNTHQVTYYIDWVETISTSVSNECFRDYWGHIGPQDHEAQRTVEILPAQEKLEIDFVPTSSISYATRFCDEVVVELGNLTISEVDGYTRAELTQEIQTLQTSP